MLVLNCLDSLVSVPHAQDLDKEPKRLHDNEQIVPEVPNHAILRTLERVEDEPNKICLRPAYCVQLDEAERI